MSAFAKPAPGTKVLTTSLGAGISSYYLLGDNAGTIVDSGPNNIAGTITGTLSWGASPDPTVISGECLNGFAGVGGATPTTAYVDLGNSSALNPVAAVAYEVWYFPTSLPGNAAWTLTRDDGTGTGGGRSYRLGFLSGLDILFHINGSAVVQTNGTGVHKTVVNQWNHMVCTGSAASNVWNAYLNNGLVGTAAWVAPNTSTTNTQIGLQPDSFDQSAFKGTIGMVAIHNTLLSAGDVNNLFTNPGIVFPSAVGVWNLALGDWSTRPAMQPWNELTQNWATPHTVKAWDLATGNFVTRTTG
jgi:hypothetical protein